MNGSNGTSRLGVMIVGLGGAVATTAVSGIAMIAAGGTDRNGLPLADLTRSDLVDYGDIVFDGWDVCGDDLAAAMRGHRVLDGQQAAEIAPVLERIRPRAAVGGTGWCANIDGTNKVVGGHRAAVAQIACDIEDFRTSAHVRDVVVINLASVERTPDLTSPALATLHGFETALDADDAGISPAMLYAYAAIAAGVPYGNFTPSAAADVPALVELANLKNVPVAGKDGKTGQTMLKTVLAPALRSRALHVEGWFSTNILGNRDGLALADPASLQAKLDTKGSVLDSILGYPVEDHVVQIHYYRPRGDNKEAWDNIDVVGFLGQKMQIKVDFLCKDSILAAPLVIEIARCLDLARRRGEGGIREELGAFFKAPMTRAGRTPVHAFDEQNRRLRAWLSGDTAAVPVNGARRPEVEPALEPVIR